MCIQGFSSIIVVTPPDSDTQVKDVEEELDYDENMDMYIAQRIWTLKRRTMRRKILINPLVQVNFV